MTSSGIERMGRNSNGSSSTGRRSPGGSQVHPSPRTLRDGSIPQATALSRSPSMASMGSLWSSADLPFYLDARKSGNDLFRSSSQQWQSDQSRSSGSRSFSRSRTSSKGGDRSHSTIIQGVPMDVTPSKTSSIGWRVPSDTSAMPTSPGALSDDLSAFPMTPEQSGSKMGVRTSSGSSRQSVSQRMTQQGSQASALLDEASTASPARRFQSRKPVALQIQPVAFTLPLPLEDETPGPSSGPAHSEVPSLGTVHSPSPSQETEPSLDIRTPMTAMEPSPPVKQTTLQPIPPQASIDAQGRSLYARAGQFFSADYTMSAPPATAHDFRSSGSFPQPVEAETMTPAATLMPGAQASGRRPSLTSTQTAPAGGNRSSFGGAAAAAADSKNLPTVMENAGSPRNSAAPVSPLKRHFPKSPSGRLSPSASQSTSVDGSSQLPTSFAATQRRPSRTLWAPPTLEEEGPSSSAPLPPPPRSPNAAAHILRRKASVKERLRTFSTPKLHSAWLQARGSEDQQQQQPLNISRHGSLLSIGQIRGSKASLLSRESLDEQSQSDDVGQRPGTSSRSSNASSARLRDLDTASVRESSDNERVRASSIADPRSIRNASVSSMDYASMMKTPKSPPASRPKSKQGWSSYLQEGLTLHLDQGGKREKALWMPYLAYDPFGRPEALVHASELGAGPSTPRKANKMTRPLSAQHNGPYTSMGFGHSSNGDDELGTLEFARPAFTAPTPPVSFSTREVSPILRHLGIGTDTKADLLTRQAALSIEENGVHEVSGFERQGRIAWRFTYEVVDIYDSEGTASTVAKGLKPVSFACSATLLDPTRARKARLFKMMKKGVSSTLASSLVQPSPDVSMSGSGVVGNTSRSGTPESGYGTATNTPVLRPVSAQGTPSPRSHLQQMQQAYHRQQHQQSHHWDLVDAAALAAVGRRPSGQSQNRRGLYDEDWKTPPQGSPRQHGSGGFSPSLAPIPPESAPTLDQLPEAALPTQSGSSLGFTPRGSIGPQRSMHDLSQAYNHLEVASHRKEGGQLQAAEEATAWRRSSAVATTHAFSKRPEEYSNEPRNESLPLNNSRSTLTRAATSNGIPPSQQPLLLSSSPSSSRWSQQTPRRRRQRPQTASEEIKQAYLIKELQKEWDREGVFAPSEECAQTSSEANRVGALGLQGMSGNESSPSSAASSILAGQKSSTENVYLTGPAAPFQQQQHGYSYYSNHDDDDQGEQREVLVEDERRDGSPAKRGPFSPYRRHAAVAAGKTLPALPPA